MKRRARPRAALADRRMAFRNAEIGLARKADKLIQRISIMTRELERVQLRRAEYERKIQEILLEMSKV